MPDPRVIAVERYGLTSILPVGPRVRVVRRGRYLGAGNVSRSRAGSKAAPIPPGTRNEIRARRDTSAAATRLFIQNLVLLGSLPSALVTIPAWTDHAFRQKCSCCHLSHACPHQLSPFIMTMP